MSTMTPLLNHKLQKYYTRFNFDGLGFDFAQMVPPKVTDDDIVSLFMNGTFFSRNG